MKQIAAIYTGASLLAPLSGLLKEQLPDCKVINILDDALIGEVNESGRITSNVRRRLLAYYQSAANCDVDIILNTCSSIGEVVYEAQPFVPVPIVRIDDAMAIEAVENYNRIGVIATLKSTLDPTCRLLQRWADVKGKRITLEHRLASGAFSALNDGDLALHDSMIADEARELASGCEVIVLAQGSMARMEKALSAALNMPVLSSPIRGIAMVRDMLKRM